MNSFSVLFDKGEKRLYISSYKICKCKMVSPGFLLSQHYSFPPSHFLYHFDAILSPHRCLTRRARPTRQAIDLSRKLLFTQTQTFLESTILVTCWSLYDNVRKLYRGSLRPELDQPRLRGLDRGRGGLSLSESPGQWTMEW